MKTINILKIMFLVLIGIASSGCGKCPEPEVIKVPQKCVVPYTECNKYKHTSPSIEGDLMKCIIELRVNSKVCQ